MHVYCFHTIGKFWKILNYTIVSWGSYVVHSVCIWWQIRPVGSQTQTSWAEMLRILRVESMSIFYPDVSAWESLLRDLDSLCQWCSLKRFIVVTQGFLGVTSGCWFSQKEGTFCLPSGVGVSLDWGYPQLSLIILSAPLPLGTRTELQRRWVAPSWIFPSFSK